MLDALNAKPFEFTQIDGEKLKIAIDGVIGPDTVKVIEGKGMPILDDNPLGPIKKSYQRGNLIIKFDIEFPKYLSECNKQELTAILDEQ